MADISKIEAPNGSEYNIKDLYRGCEFIYGTQTAATGTWTGVSKDSELVDGKQILYFLPFAGSGNATLNLTLADGTKTGAKNVYFQSNTRMTTHYGQYSQFRLIYHKSHKIGNTNYEGWWSEPGRDTSTTNATQMQLNGNALVAASALAKYNIIVANSSGKYVHLKSNTPFDITYPIVYLSADCAANAATSNVFTETNFTVTTTQSITLTAQKPVFVKGTLSGNIFTPISATPLTQSIPTTDDGYHYLYLGYGYAATAIRLQPFHPVYAFKNGAFGPCSESAGDANTVNGHEVQQDIPDVLLFKFESAPSLIKTLTGNTVGKSYGYYDYTGGKYRLRITEFKFIVTVGNTVHHVIVDVPVDAVTTTEQTFRTGWFQNSSNGGGAYIAISYLAVSGSPELKEFSYNLKYCYLNGSDVTSASKVDVYTRSYLDTYE